LVDVSLLLLALLLLLLLLLLMMMMMRTVYYCDDGAVLINIACSQSQLHVSTVRLKTLFTYFTQY